VSAPVPKPAEAKAPTPTVKPPATQLLQALRTEQHPPEQPMERLALPFRPELTNLLTPKEKMEVFSSWISSLLPMKIADVDPKRIALDVTLARVRARR